MRRPLTRMTAAVVLVAALGATVLAQPQAPAAPETPQDLFAAAAASAERVDERATLTYYNRPIVVLRARVLGRPPAERADIAVRVLDNLVAARATDPIESRLIQGGSLIFVGSRLVVGLSEADVDQLAGETVEGVTALTVSRLKQAFAEAAEAHTPVELFRAAGLAVLALGFGALLLWALARARRVVTAKLTAVAESTMASLTDLVSLRASRLLDFQRWLVTAIMAALQLVIVYGLVSFVLGLFPYTRRWGESLSEFLLTTVQGLALGAADAVPGLFAVLVIFVVARLLTRLVAMWFNAVEGGRITPRWIYPETAQPTRRIVITLVWVFAIVVAYPYMPGSGTDAFKGVSVFLGLMLTLGSSGLVNQIMSGFMVTYSRALRLGDYVRVGDVEGTVTHLGILSTKIKTYYGEEATVPNALVVSQTTTDYTRLAERRETFTPTSVTIGYDTPWRQVHAMLIQAAERTSGILREPKPYVLQEALQDFYVKYTLCVCLDDQAQRHFTLNTLHAQIQDLFNEYGVQIMSPNYMSDPASPKVIAKKDWYLAPARADEQIGAR